MTPPERPPERPPGMLSGAAWVVAWRLCTRLLGLASIVVLARLMPPAAFGLVAVAAAFVQLLDAATTIGAEDSLVRAARTDRALLDTAFTLNLLRAAVSAALIAALAHPVAAFFGDPAVAPILLVLAAAALLDGATNIGIIAFRRDMRFDREFRLQLGPRLVGVLLTMVLAWLWQDHWALVAGIAVQRALRVAGSYLAHPYRPRLSLAAWRELLAFSAWSWATMMVIQLRDRAETLLVGRALGAGAVGLYDTGREIAMLPVTELSEPICRAAYSGFAAARNAGGDPGPGCVRVMATLLLLCLPAAAGLLMVAAPLVRLALGEAWMGAVPVLQAMAMAAMFTAPGMVCSTLLRAYGLLALGFRVTLASLPPRLAVLLLALPDGGIALAAQGVAAVTVLGRIATVMLTFRHFAIRWTALAAETWRSAAATAAMAGVLAAAGLGQDAGQAGGATALALQLALATAAGAATYGGVLAGLWLLCGRPRGAEADALAWLARQRRRVPGLCR